LNVKRKNENRELTAAEKAFFDRLESSVESKSQVWFENADFLPNGSMYHTGGEDGIYIRIKKDGSVDAGNYTAALPGIDNAVLESIIEGKFPNHHEAVNKVIDFAGMRFYVDTMTEASERMQKLVEADQNNEFNGQDFDIDYNDIDEGLEL